MASSSKHTNRKKSRDITNHPPSPLGLGSVRRVDPAGLRTFIHEHETALGNTLQSIAKQEEYQIEYHSLTNTLKHLPDKLSHDALVPLGPLVMAKGRLIHTNEITCHIGDNWFVQCSAKTAEKISLHRIQKSNEMLRKFQEEKELITSWIEEGKRQLAECESEETVEITEVCDEQEELQWRKKHRENVRRHYQQVAREKKKQNSSEVPLPSSTVDQDLMERLEMLELEEELHEYEAKQNQGLNKVEEEIPPPPPPPESLKQRRVSFDPSKDIVHSYPAEPKTTPISSHVAEHGPMEEDMADGFKRVVIEKTFSAVKRTEPPILPETSGGGDESEEKPPERMSLFKQRKMMREQEYLT